MNAILNKLFSSIELLRQQDSTGPKECKDALNQIFLSDGSCVNFIYTLNTDKLPFGCIVMPRFTDDEIKGWFLSGDARKVSNYEVEVDSKLFDYGLSNEQVAEVILYNIFHLIKDTNPNERFRTNLDIYLTNNETQMSIRDSSQYCRILDLGLCDALVQYTNCMYIIDTVEDDAFLDSMDFHDFNEVLNHLFKQIPGCENETTRAINLNMLQWVLRLYTDIEKQRIPAIKTMEKVKDVTASALYINKFNKVISALNKIDTDMYVTESVNSFIHESMKKGSLFHQIRRNGLKGIEADMYEYIVMARNAETESEVMYALKQINIRLSILDDYLTYEDIDDAERARWEGVRNRYLEIRDNIAKKKVYNRKNYGVFVDYNKLDQLDDPEDEGYY